MIGLLNLGSLLLGLIAWIFPVVNLVKYNKNDNSNWITLSIMSISACSISLYFQILYNNYKVMIADWSALMDTTNAVAFVAAVLLVGTIVLNMITLFVYRDRREKKKK